MGDILEKALGFLKGLVIKPDGSINIIGVLGIAGGALLGGFGALGFLVEGGVAGALVGAGLGVGLSALASLIFPSDAPATGATDGKATTGNTVVKSEGSAPAQGTGTHIQPPPRNFGPQTNQNTRST